MAKILKPTDRNIAQLAAELESGGVVAIPTETVYGLAANSRDEKAVKNIFKIKQRPGFNPLISHYASLAKVAEDVVVNEKARKLAAEFWPGPLTMVLRRKADCKISDIVCAGLKTAAVRVPAHKVIRKLLKEINFPLAAPSANPSGRLSPVSAENVEKMLGKKLKFILDGGECAVGLESTIIDLSTSKPAILREGVITREQIEKIIGKVSVAKHGSKIKAPGMLLKHYAPNCPVRLVDGRSSMVDGKKGEALLTFGNQPIPQGFDIVLNLSKRGNLAEAATNLFKFMHQLENRGVSGIAVMPIPNKGIGKAINERLSKAAE